MSFESYDDFSLSLRKGINKVKGLKRMKNTAELYKSILLGKTALDDLGKDDTASLFNYLCEETECGVNVDRDLFLKLEAKTEAPGVAPADEIISKTYRRLSGGGSKKHVRGFSRKMIRRWLVAAVAVFTFALFSIGTASALGFDVVERVKVIFTEQTPDEKNVSQSEKITMERLEPQRTVNTKKLYTDIEKLFSAEFPEYIYPAEFPDGISPYYVTDCRKVEDDSHLFITELKSENGGESWRFFAKPAEESYMPMGYEYTAELEGGTLDFVYTVSRNNGTVSKYSVYTVYEGVQYTFYLYTSEWEEVKLMLDSVKLP